MLLPSALIAAFTIGATAATATPQAYQEPVLADSADTTMHGPVDAIAASVKPRAWKEIVLHHSATAEGNVASIDAAHRNNRDRSGNPWLGIGYHFVVGNGQKMTDGEIQPTFRWQQQLAGAHAGTRDHNDRSIGICLIGNFDQTAPTAQQVKAVRGLVKLLAERYSIPREHLLRHLDVQATLCPGRMFPWELVRADLLPSSGR